MENGGERERYRIGEREREWEREIELEREREEKPRSDLCNYCAKYIACVVHFFSYLLHQSYD